MALANFFDRAATAASQVLADFEYAAFATLLARQVVGVALDGAAAGSPEGQATLDLTVRLLSRLYPSISILPLDNDAGETATALQHLAKSINPKIAAACAARRMTICLAVGDTRPAVACPTIFVGSHGWRARLSSARPVGSGPTGNPFGAGAAASFGAANVFRAIFAQQLVGGVADTAIDLSLLTYSGDAGEAAELTEVNIGETHLVGLGAIGNGTVWALARTPRLSGDLHLIDHEPVELSNLQRYVLTDQSSRGRIKVELAKEALAGSALRVTSHERQWGAYLEARQDWRLPRVAVALDTVHDRIAVQGALPQWIVNAWTQDIDLGVSRHAFDDDRPCLTCLYLPSGKVADEDERLAEDLKMPEAKMEIRQLLQTNAGVSADFIARVAAAYGIAPEALVDFAGQNVRTFFQKAVCGGLMMRLTNGAHSGAAVVPMAFQSAMAGIMLAAELVKHAIGQPAPPTPIARINLLRPLSAYLNDPRARDVSGRCVCADPDFIAAYRRKYHLGAP